MVRGRQQGHRGKALGTPQGRGLGGAATVGEADDIGLLDSDGIENADQLRDQQEYEALMGSAPEETLAAVRARSPQLYETERVT